MISEVQRLVFDEEEFTILGNRNYYVFSMEEEGYYRVRNFSFDIDDSFKKLISAIKTRLIQVFSRFLFGTKGRR